MHGAAHDAEHEPCRTENKKDNDEWVEYISKVSARAVRFHQSNDPEMDKMLRLRLTCKRLYKSIPCQESACMRLLAL